MVPNRLARSTRGISRTHSQVGEMQKSYQVERIFKGPFFRAFSCGIESVERRNPGIEGKGNAKASAFQRRQELRRTGIRPGKENAQGENPERAHGTARENHPSRPNALRLDGRCGRGGGTLALSKARHFIDESIRPPRLRRSNVPRWGKDQRFFHSGFRLSRNALSPSWASSVFMSSFR